MNQNVIRAAVTVFGFWWTVLAVYSVVAGPYDIDYLIRSSLAVLVIAC